MTRGSDSRGCCDRRVGCGEVRIGCCGKRMTRGGEIEVCRSCAAIVE